MTQPVDPTYPVDVYTTDGKVVNLQLTADKRAQFILDISNTADAFFFQLPCTLSAVAEQDYEYIQRRCIARVTY